MNWMGFDINTASTPKPWGPREETMVKELIQTMVGNTIGSTKRTSGHLHNLLHNEDTTVAINAYVETGKRVIDIGKQKQGHLIGINVPEGEYNAFSVNSCNAWFNTPAIAVDATNGPNCKVSVGDHYSGYPLVCDTGDHVYTRDWANRTTDFEILGFSAFETYNGISYMEIGNLGIMHMNIWGTSNQTYFRIRTPFQIRMGGTPSNCCIGIVHGHNNGASIGPIEALFNIAEQRIEIGTPGVTDTFWTASGIKGAVGYLIFTIPNPAHGWYIP
jgi:hypothetical protein